jgi:lysophospholipase L1-like esterase
VRPIVAALGLAFAPLGAIGYVLVRSQAPPRNAPRRFRRDPSKTTVVVLGASMIHGRVSTNVIDLLAERLGPSFQLVNAGVNGDLAYNARQRLPDVLACAPDVVVVLVGSNDVMASLNPENEARYRRMKRLPERPTLAWYREQVRAIVTTLKAGGADVALCSLPPLGEDLRSEVNEKVAAYGAAVAEIARDEAVTYLPVREDFEAVLRAERPEGGRAFDGGAMMLMLKAMGERYLLGKSFDAIGAQNGFLLLTDAVHLRPRGAELVANRMQEFIVRHQTC